MLYLGVVLKSGVLYNFFLLRCRRLDEYQPLVTSTIVNYRVTKTDITDHQCDAYCHSLKIIPKSCVNELGLKYYSLFQMILPGSRIFASIVHIPLFPAYNVKDNVCELSEKKWIPNFFSLTGEPL